MDGGQNTGDRIQNSGLEESGVTESVQGRRFYRATRAM
jgi:hypothetical protein